MNRTVLLLFCVIFPFVLCADPCSSLSIVRSFPTITSGTPLQYLSCYNQIRFDQEQANLTLAALRDIATLYSFTEIACFPPAGFTTSCLPIALDAIEEKILSDGYANDYEFHYDVAKVFTGLRDAHTTYMPPAGYSQCAIERDWKVGVHDIDFSFVFQPSTQSKYSDYAGYVVTSINGKQPWDFIQAKSQLIGFYKDEVVRMNAALNTFIYEDVSTIHLANYLKADSLQLQDGGNFVTVSIPVTVLCVGDRTSLSGVQNLNSETRNSTTTRSFVDFREERDNLLHKLKGTEPVSAASLIPISSKPQKAAALQLDRSWGTQQSASPQIVASRSGDVDDLELISGTLLDNSLLIWRYKDVPVWKIGSFLPKSQAEFLNVLTTAISSSKNLNDKTLILDVSQNGGGSICLNDLLLTLLVPSWDNFVVNNDSVWSLYDLKKNKFNDQWVTQVAELYDDYRDPKTGEQVAAAAAWYYSGTVNKTFGNFENVPFIRKAFWPGDCNEFESFAPSIRYYFDSILLVSDGTCGSACGYFASKLQHSGYAKVMTYGGYSHMFPDISSFAGGNVLEYANLIQITSNTSIHVNEVPSSAALRFNDHMVYFGSEIPREFTKFLGDYHSFVFTPLTDINPLSSINDYEAGCADLYATALGILEPSSASSVNSVCAFLILVLVLVVHI